MRRFDCDGCFPLSLSKPSNRYHIDSITNTANTENTEKQSTFSLHSKKREK